MIRILLPALGLLALVGPVRAQVEERPLPLAAALAEARAGNADLAVAEAERAIAAAGAREAGAFLWPSAGAGYSPVRSTDPVFAFGARLRQGTFTEADFALDALNDPDPLEDWSATADVRWGALDPALWAGRAAARREAESAAWRALRAREATDLQTRVLYWSAARAAARREAARVAEEAAVSTLDLFDRRRERGLLTEADRLRAVAERAAAEAERIEAERAERDARRALALFLGWDAGVLPVPTDTLEAPAAVPAGSFEPAARADLRALGAAVDARRAGVRRAGAAYLPALDAFGQYAVRAEGAFESDDSDWTVGLALRWTAFAGFARSAERDRAAGLLEVARVRYDQALRAARTELDAAEDAVRAATARAGAALAAREAAETAAGLVRRRFEEGLATATDVLQAEARRAAMRGGAIDALAEWRVAAARVDFHRSVSHPEDLP